VFTVPHDMTPADAVAVALAGVVAMNQFMRAGFTPGQRVIVQGATSALGSTTALLARHLGAKVVVTSRHESKRARLRARLFGNEIDNPLVVGHSRWGKFRTRRTRDWATTAPRAPLSYFSAARITPPTSRSAPEPRWRWTMPVRKRCS
jgi:NADPH:quinone reductase-like Zn-dependent oxidoreductase